MSVFYVYPLSPEEFHAFTTIFIDLPQRNDEFIICSHPNSIYGWLDPETVDNRRRVVLTPAEDVIYVLAHTGRADWDFVRWIAANEIPMGPPIQIYF